MKEILTTARAHLVDSGASGLSLRAVARDLGMVSSGIYRYFKSRDDLLTALIIDGYNALGRAVEDADAECSVRHDYPTRWIMVCTAVRDWALENPHEYALLYGSPVPGYRAPHDTIEPALRDTVVYGSIVREAHEADAIVIPNVAVKPPRIVAADAKAVRDMVMQGVPADVITRALTAWTALFGWVSFELFGQFDNVISERDEFFDHTVTGLSRFIGLTKPQ